VDQSPVGGDGAVSGTAFVHCILTDEKGNASPARLELPFKAPLCDGSAGKSARSVSADVAGLRVYVEGGALCAEGEVCISAVITEKTQHESVCSVKAQKTEKLSKKSGITVVYPQVGDTLWSVAKRYNVAPTAVSGDPASDKYVLIG
jgi:hypothetical protein